MVKAARPELSLIEFEIKPGGGVQPHFHKGHSDSFFVLEGELEFHVGDEVVHGSPGTYVARAAGSRPLLQEREREPARALNLHTPGGFAEYRRELEALRARGDEPDAAFFERHDIFDVE